MGTSRAITERQLKLAKDAVTARIKALQQKGLEASACESDPAWRQLDSRFRRVGARLRKVTEMEALQVEVHKRHEERLVSLAQKKAQKKAGGKKSAAKAEEKPAKKKADGGGKDKAAKPKKEKTDK